MIHLIIKIDVFIKLDILRNPQTAGANPPPVIFIHKYVANGKSLIWNI